MEMGRNPTTMLRRRVLIFEIKMYTHNIKRNFATRAISRDDGSTPGQIKNGYSVRYITV